MGRIGEEENGVIQFPCSTLPLTTDSGQYMLVSVINNHEVSQRKLGLSCQQQ